MGKKKPEIMRPYAEKFVAGAIEERLQRDDRASEIWDNIVKFGGYGFNKSHSTAYALITYQTAYLKANHRTRLHGGEPLVRDGGLGQGQGARSTTRKRAGIAVRGPDIARSGWEFEPEDGAIRFGFGAIKGTGEQAIAAMVAARARARRARPAARAPRPVPRDRPAGDAAHRLGGADQGRLLRCGRP